MPNYLAPIFFSDTGHSCCWTNTVKNPSFSEVRWFWFLSGTISAMTRPWNGTSSTATTRSCLTTWILILKCMYRWENIHSATVTRCNTNLCCVLCCRIPFLWWWIMYLYRVSFMTEQGICHALHVVSFQICYVRSKPHKLQWKPLNLFSLCFE